MFRIVNLEALFALGAPDADPPAGSPEDWGERVQVRDAQLAENQGQWEAGERVEDTLSPRINGVHGIGEITGLLLEGRLPGGPVPPPGWRPNLGLRDLRLLDEF